MMFSVPVGAVDSPIWHSVAADDEPLDRMMVRGLESGRDTTGRGAAWDCAVARLDTQIARIRPRARCRTGHPRGPMLSLRMMMSCRRPIERSRIRALGPA